MAVARSCLRPRTSRWMIPTTSRTCSSMPSRSARPARSASGRRRPRRPTRCGARPTTRSRSRSADRCLRRCGFAASGTRRAIRIGSTWRRIYISSGSTAPSAAPLSQRRRRHRTGPKSTLANVTFWKRHRSSRSPPIDADGSRHGLPGLARRDAAERRSTVSLRRWRGRKRSPRVLASPSAIAAAGAARLAEHVIVA